MISKPQKGIQTAFFVFNIICILFRAARSQGFDKEIFSEASAQCKSLRKYRFMKLFTQYEDNLTLVSLEAQYLTQNFTLGMVHSPR